MRVVIAGAGLGGLCLAHGLRRGGVDVVVLERHPTRDARPASYGIHLNADGLRALHTCLPGENWARLVETSTLAPDIVRFHDQDLRVLAERDHTGTPANTDPVTRRRAVNRDALRDALLLGCDDVIRWGTAFDRFEYTGEGVRVHGADGRAIEADLLVGADGANSRVREQRLPGLRREDLGIVNIAGRVRLTPELASALPETLIDGAVNNVVPARPGWMFLSTWDAGAEARYVVWAWAADRSTYPDDLDVVDLRELVQERTATWAPPLRRIIAETDPATLAAIPLKTMPELPHWAPTAVTLLGDAIHNMTPMAGIGANTALRDADTLRRHLAGGGGVRAYEDEMRDYANAALALSTRNARGAATTSRLPRHAFRTVLRLAEALPPVKQRMFPVR
ncbi:NAD(P)/FAD-dependent oxidoreductase [Amycolatopsis sp., V23-08]|uniref:NAD(P)/FAD-dependent oxidoreductase n=1 Tax=Amycolatopsis heterodermiae TaxID=3110235 RepID=A0ABU5RA52_9PSEU|nr:NAD(P)/FAD-dependent oxidoreductase [Amycolatopsis sp., V23-08]MEA5363143.1 NAD(P)/FAD-dependent oxidoreductase [Amycolatopsis sp., V23-08]